MNGQTCPLPLTVMPMSTKHLVSKEKTKEYTNRYRLKYPARRLLQVAKSRAKKRNIEFNITLEDIQLPTHCPILGIPLKCHIDQGAGGKDSSYSLDRIDPKKGYIKENIQVISHKANSMKFTANKDELLKFADWIYKEYKND